MPPLDEVVASLRGRGIELPRGNLSLGYFGDSQELSDCLVELICAGQKRATSSLLWAYECDGDELPQVGDVEIVIDYAGSPAAVIVVTAVFVLPFDAVPAEFAAAEGEGDRSLAAWRRAHWDFFSRECQQIGRVAEESMPVVCYEFEVRAVIAGRRDRVS